MIIKKPCFLELFLNDDKYIVVTSARISVKYTFVQDEKFKVTTKDPDLHAK